MVRLKCQADTPYPPIRVKEKNLKYAAILSESYAGSGGEDTAIHTYLFQSFINDDASSTLKEIAQVEMHHLAILASLITKLGARPYFCIDKGNKIIPWTSDYLNYTVRLKEFLLNDIMMEKATIKRYEEAIFEINDADIKEILKRIIEDEKCHINALTYLYNKYV